MTKRIWFFSFNRLDASCLECGLIPMKTCFFFLLRAFRYSGTASRNRSREALGLIRKTSSQVSKAIRAMAETMAKYR